MKDGGDHLDLSEPSDKTHKCGATQCVRVRDNRLCIIIASSLANSDSKMIAKRYALVVFWNMQE